MAKLTLIGMHNYSNGDIWADAVFPTDFDKDAFINTVLLNYGEMEVLFSDAEMMRYAITNWANINSWSILKAITAMNVEYDPLNNYDRTETRTRSESGTNTGTVTDAGTTSATTSTSTVTDRDETNETEHKVSAYDSSSYSPDNTDDGSNTLDETITGSGTSSGTSGNTRTDNLAHAITESESVRAYGNIGVTTSQQMLQSELDIALYNVYTTFAGLFAFDLLLMVY